MLQRNLKEMKKSNNSGKSIFQKLKKMSKICHTRNIFEGSESLEIEVNSEMGRSEIKKSVS